MRGACATCSAVAPAGVDHPCAAVVALRAALVARHGDAATLTFVWNGGEYIARLRVAGGVAVECATSGLDGRAVLAALARELNVTVGA